MGAAHTTRVIVYQHRGIGADMAEYLRCLAAIFFADRGVAALEGDFGCCTHFRFDFLGFICQWRFGVLRLLS